MKFRMEPNEARSMIAQNGIVDIPSIYIPKPSYDAMNTGFQAMAGPFLMEDLERALEILPRQSETVNRVEEIDPRFVLATAWNSDRFKNAVHLLRTRGEPPEIWVTAYRVPGIPTLYVTTDGMHRAVAARMHGERTIKARIETFVRGEPERLVLDNGFIYTRKNGGLELSIFSRKGEGYGVCDAAAALGATVTWSRGRQLWRKARGL